MEKPQEILTSAVEQPSFAEQGDRIEVTSSVYKPVERSAEDLEKIEQIRRELGLEAGAPVHLLEGISLADFDSEKLEILRTFYKNRETRQSVVNPDLHLRNSDRMFTKIGAYAQELRGKPAMTKNIEVTEGSSLEAGEDFSLQYLDVEHEVQPVYGEIEKSVNLFISKAQEEKQDMQVVLEKKDFQSFVKKTLIGGKVVEEATVPIENNTLWQALKRGKYEINLLVADASISHQGGGGGESVGVYAQVSGDQSRWQEAVARLESLTLHEYTHVNQVAVNPKFQNFAATLNYSKHATDPAEIQARVHEAIHIARKQGTNFESALAIVLNRYSEENKERISKEKGASEIIEKEAPQLHKEFFDSHYGQVKTLYPGL